MRWISTATHPKTIYRFLLMRGCTLGNLTFAVMTQHPICLRGGMTTMYTPRKMMVWKMSLLSHMAILGIFVRLSRGKLCTTFDDASQELQLQQVVNLYHLWTFGSWLSGKKSDDSSSRPRKQSDHLLGRDVLDGNRSIPGNSMTKMIATGCQSKGAEEKYKQKRKTKERKGELELGKWLTNVYLKLALVGDAKKTQKTLERITGTVGESSDQF